MLGLPNYSGLIAQPWPGGGESYWTRTSKSNVSVDQEPAADLRKKNAGSNPQDRGDHEARDGG